MKTAFTLTETLITLGIIGVVAALTIPSIIKNYQKKQTAIKLKQTYSLLTQGIRMAENSLGSTEGWEIVDSTTFSETYIKPYFKVIKEYNSDELPLNYQISCNDEGTCDTYGGFPRAQKLILPNGILIAPHIYKWTISGKTYVSATIIVDINGLKPPNRYGRDVFMFNIDSSSDVGQRQSELTLIGDVYFYMWHTADEIEQGMKSNLEQVLSGAGLSGVLDELVRQFKEVVKKYPDYKYTYNGTDYYNFSVLNFDISIVGLSFKSGNGIINRSGLNGNCNYTDINIKGTITAGVANAQFSIPVLTLAASSPFIRPSDTYEGNQFVLAKLRQPSLF